MSLLLDALKKAAEQKAKQAKDANDGSDATATNTVVGSRLEDGTTVLNEKTERLEDSTDFIEDRTEFAEDRIAFVEDATEFDEIKTDFTEDRTIFAEDESEFDDDDTQIITDSTEIPTSFTTDDKTEVTELVDQTEATELVDQTEATELVDQTEATELIDKTEVTELVDQTQVTELVDKTEAAETLDLAEAKETVDLTEATEATDQTEVETDELVVGGQDTESTSTQTVSDDVLLSSFNEDETVSQLSNSDVVDFLGEPGAIKSSDVTVEATSSAVDVPDDLSLYLAERGPDDTTLTADSEAEHATTTGSSAETQTASPSDTLTANANIEILASDAKADTDGLEVGEQHKKQADPTVTSATDPSLAIATGVKLESLRHEKTIVRPDATSTHTYAPDNYDRTLIRPPSDDASRIFAGMKSEEDVLMTPDYAKRVFLSKYSANRAQHYKIYFGIAAIVLLAVVVYMLFEFQDEHNRIDTTLAPLKRDPLPGMVKAIKYDEKGNITIGTTQPDADTKTLKIVENAGLQTASDNITETNTTVAGTATTANEPEPDVVSEVSDQTRSNQVQTVAVVKQPAESVADQVVNNTVKVKVSKLDETPDKGQQSSSNLQITSNSQITDKDRWLAEAYSAYQRGDDKTALEAYARVLEVDPTNRNALLARAAIAVQNGDSASAINNYRQLLLLNPKDSLAMSSLISVTSLTPGQSESQLKLLIRDEPDSPHLNFVLANVYSTQNRWQEAQKLYFKALENNPGDPNYAYNLAVSLEHIAKPKVAITYYERAISNIENGLATFNKAVVDHRIEMLRQL